MHGRKIILEELNTGARSSNHISAAILMLQYAEHIA